MHGLVLRQGMPLKVMPLLGFQGPAPSYYLESFIRRALHLPELLERVDSISNSHIRPVELITSSIEQLQTLDGELISSLPHELRSSRTLFSCVAITEFDFDVRSHVFPDALRFPSFLSAVSHTLIWTCLLALRSAQQELISVLPSAAHPQPDQGKRSVSCSEPDEVSNMLCKSIPYLLCTAGEAMAQAIAVRTPLYFVKRYFEHINSCDRLEWCCKVEAEVRARVGFFQWDALLPWGFLWLNSLSS